MKVALVHDWITNQGGAENVLWALHTLFPEAPIFTSVFNPERMKKFSVCKINTSFLQNIPLAKKKHQLFLSLFPRAFESFDLKDYDLVISSSHSCAKGIVTKLETLHICYCYTPMRYAWDDSHEYIKNSNYPFFIKKWYIPKVMEKIRIWDRLSADRVDHFISISNYIRQRILKYYKKDSTVIYPPVETNKFHISNNLENYFLAAGRLIPYKKFDLVVETFNRSGLPLKIAGVGPEFKKLRKMAKKNIEFLGFVTDNDLPELFSKCQAMIFPQVEDFGIAPVEVMASGRPVIAYRFGGAKEIVTDPVSGIFFNEQSVESVQNAINIFHNTNFDPINIKKSSEKFDIEVFKNKMISFVNEKYSEWNKNLN